MTRPTLRLFDGYGHTSPQLRKAVRELQRCLRKQRLHVTLDGYFGRETESAVLRFQSERHLVSDGIAGPRTWAALLGKRAAAPSAAGLETTFARDDRDLLAQLAEARRYRTLIEAAAREHGLAPALVAGVGSRESAWGLALEPKGPGGTGDFFKRAAPTALRRGPVPHDGGFGRGLMQIDFDAHEFARTGDWRDPAENIRYGCKVLADNCRFFERSSRLRDTALSRAALAAYNCGPGNVLRALNSGLDPDYFTAHRNYSADTLNRAGFFCMHGW